MGTSPVPANPKKSSKSNIALANPPFDERVTQYIAEAAEFARPVLLHLRTLIHKSCPEIKETIKWGNPFFEYNGASVCFMAAFMRHCAFGFWKASLLRDPQGAMRIKDKESRGHFGRISNLKDLPADNLLRSLILEAVSLNEMGAGNKKADPVKSKKTPSPIAKKNGVKKVKNSR
jgi:hypothetical protein